MIPITPDNQQDMGDPVSSNLVIWQGPDIPCLKICRGDSISDIVAKAAYQLCEIWKQIGMDPATATFLPIPAGFELPENCFPCPDPTNFHDLIQAIINKLCACCDSTATPTVVTETDCPTGECCDVTCLGLTTVNFNQKIYKVTLADYTSILTGDAVNPITGQRGLLCDLLTKQLGTEQAVFSQGQQINSLQQSVNTLESAPPAEPLPVFITTCLTDRIPVIPADGIPLATMVDAVEKAFCDLRSATGMPNEILGAVFTQPTNLDTSPVLNLPGVNMGSLPGWTLQSQLNTLAGSITNLWITISDLRAAVTTVMNTCCPRGCDALVIDLQVTFAGTTISFFWTGNVTNFEDCNPAGSLITITDAYGANYITRIPIVAYVNTTYTLNLSGTPVNTATNLSLSIDACFNNTLVNANCERCIEKTIINTTACPALVLSADSSSITYQFNNTVTGAVTYTVTLTKQSDGTFVDSQTVVTSTPGSITGTFNNNLLPGTIYVATITITIDGVITNTCPVGTITTADLTCDPPTEVSTETDPITI